MQIELVQNSIKYALEEGLTPKEIIEIIENLLKQLIRTNTTKENNNGKSFSLD